MGKLDLSPRYGPRHAGSSGRPVSNPSPGNPANIQVTYFAHMAVFRRTENEIISTMELTVSPDDPVEIRRMHLHNKPTSRAACA